MGCCIGWCRGHKGKRVKVESRMGPIRSMSQDELDAEADLVKHYPLADIVAIRILTYNLFIRPPGIKTNASDHKDWRLNAFLEAAKDYDVIALQETFGSFSGRRDLLISMAASHHGFTYSVVSPPPPCCVFVDGGLVILSKRPITDCDWTGYPRGTFFGGDAFAEKGGLYAKLEISIPERKDPLVFHLFNTHLQASYHGQPGSESFLIRTKQIKQLRGFIEKKTSGDKFPILFLGDFNVNARQGLKEGEVHSPEYDDLVRDFQSDHFEFTDLLFAENGSHPVTYGDVHPEDPNKPRDITLTYPLDHLSQQRLDYIFLGIKQRQKEVFYELSPDSAKKQDKKGGTVLGKKETDTDTSKDKNKAEEEIVTARIAKGTTKVAQFFTDKHDKCTQLSDHYGVETTLLFVMPTDKGQKEAVVVESPPKKKKKKAKETSPLIEKDK